MRKALLFLLACLASIVATDDAKTLFEAKCVTCHALPDPGSLGEKQWQAVLKTMQKRMREAGKPELTADEFAKIHCYLTRQNSSACSVAENR
ncbi:MAG: c-type cytochrome [Spirochaetota bacterium]